MDSIVIYVLLKHMLVRDLSLFSGRLRYAICDDVCTKVITLFLPYSMKSLNHFVTFCFQDFHIL